MTYEDNSDLAMALEVGVEEAEDNGDGTITVTINGRIYVLTVDAKDMTSISPTQHCTYENQDGVDDYSFSHTAGYCGKPQPRRCGCAFCY